MRFEAFVDYAMRCGGICVPRHATFMDAGLSIGYPRKCCPNTSEYPFDRQIQVDEHAVRLQSSYLFDLFSKCRLADCKLLFAHPDPQGDADIKHDCSSWICASSSTGSPVIVVLLGDLWPKIDSSGGTERLLLLPCYIDNDSAGSDASWYEKMNRVRVFFRCLHSRQQAKTRLSSSGSTCGSRAPA